MAGLAYEPVSYFLKDALGLGPAEAAAFVAWMTLPLALKPLLGAVSDLLPWGGRRRVPHIVAASALGAGAWLALALLPGPGYGAALALLAAVNVAMAVSDAACDGAMVELGVKDGLTPFYQAVQIGILYLTLVATGLGGGWLAQRGSPREAFLAAALFPALAAAAALAIAEARSARPRGPASPAWAGLKAFVRSPRARLLAGAIFLWSFSPLLGTAQFYYQSEALGLSPIFIGALATAGGLAGAAGAAAFWRLSGGAAESLKLARWSVLFGAPLSLLYLLYLGPKSAMLLTVLFAAAGTAARLAWMDLAARCAPEGAEAASYAAFMAVFNLAALASNAAGGRLYAAWRPELGAWGAAAVLAAAGAAATWASAPLLRRYSEARG